MTKPLLIFKDVGLKKQNNWLVQNLNFTVHLNEILTIIGPNGAGKSSLAKLALNVLQPSIGQIWRNPIIKFAYVPQKFNVDKALPIKVKRLMQVNKKLTEDELYFYLQEMDVLHLKETFISKLSGGELQRVLLARAAAQNANFLVLDEPLQAIDFANEVNIYEHINRLRSKLNCSILMISHDLNIVMLNTDRVICLDKHICCMGTAAEVMETTHYANLLGDRRHIEYNHKQSLHQ